VYHLKFTSVNLRTMRVDCKLYLQWFPTQVCLQSFLIPGSSELNVMVTLAVLYIL